MDFQVGKRLHETLPEYLLVLRIAPRPLRRIVARDRRVRTHPPPLGPIVVPDYVGCDAEQPGPSVPLGVEARDAAERLSERLRGDVESDVAPDRQAARRKITSKWAW